MKKILALTFFILFIGSSSFATTYYMATTSPTSGWNAGNNSNDGLSKSAPVLDFQTAAGLMSISDDLIIDSGIYSGTANLFDPYTWQMPYGTDTDWTTITAEVSGSVIIDGEGVRGAIYLRGDNDVDGQNYTNGKQSYIEFNGIVTKDTATSGISMAGVDHIKLINCGAVEPADGNYSGINASYSQYILFEGCYAWGSGRYKIAFYHAHYSIMRNCVSRMDRAYAPGEPTGDFSVYSSVNVEVQNCIAIDNDQTQYNVDVAEYAGNFACPTTSGVTFATGPVNITNCIGLNNDTRFASSDNNAYSANVFIKNSLGWDLRPRGSNGILKSFGNLDVQNCTFGDVISVDSGAYHFNGWTGTDMSQNNIWTTLTGNLFYSIETSNNNNIYALTGTQDSSGTASTNTKNYDPTANGLTYITEIDSGSQLEADGIGATIIKQYGRTGTLWGETGYNLLQDGTSGEADVDLWPFPNQDTIRTNMKAYSYDGGNLSGDRGFCADGENLTDYIRNYITASTNPVVNAGTDQSVSVNSASISGTYTLEGGRTVASCTWSNDRGGSGTLTAAGGTITGTVTGLSSGVNVITITVTDSEAEEGSDSLNVTYTPVVSTISTNSSNSAGCLIR